MERIRVELDDYSVLQGHDQVKQLVLWCCSRVDPMVWQLAALERLELWHCTIQSLPDEVANLQALQELFLQGCHELGSLPESLGQLQALQKLELQYCNQLVSLPESFGQLQALREVVLWHCNQLVSLPESFGQLQVLRELVLWHCNQLVSLPESFGQLQALQELKLRACNQLVSLPESLGQLQALQKLELQCFNQLVSLPESCGQLQALQRLELLACDQLVSLPESFGQLQALRELVLWHCNQLVSLPESFGQLQALRELVLWHCNQLVSLPESFGQLQALQELKLRACNQLVSLPESLGQLQALQKLQLLSCNQLISLPESFGQLQALQKLQLLSCDQLVSLPESFGQLQALQELELLSSKLVSLPAALWQLTKLWELKLSCRQLVSLPESFGKLAALTCLDLSNCTSLQLLPDSCDQLWALQKLSYVGCPAFNSILRVTSFWNAVDLVPFSQSPGLSQPEAQGQSTDTKGYQVVSFIVKQQHQRWHLAAVTKLATQQDTMLTTLERMSWLVVLLATATFIAYLQPPGGTNDQKQVLVSNVTSCSAPSRELLAGGMSGFMQCAMLLFFVFDGLSFSLSIGCLVLIVMLSMPRIHWADEQAEAGRFYVLLLFTWLLLYLAVSFGFAAFVASGLAVYERRWMVLGPVVPGMVLLLVGAAFFLKRFSTLNPGWAAVRAAMSFRYRQPAVESDVELGQARFWREWPQYLSHLGPGTASTAVLPAVRQAHGQGVDTETAPLLSPPQQPLPPDAAAVGRH